MASTISETASSTKLLKDEKQTSTLTDKANNSHHISDSEDLLSESSKETENENPEKTNNNIMSSSAQKSDKSSSNELLAPLLEKIKSISKMFNNVIQNSESEQKLKDILQTSILVNMVDTGGQLAFIEIVPLLTVGPAMYVIFFKLSEHFKECYPVKFRSHGSENDFEIDEFYTAQQVVFKTLSSLSMQCISSKSVEDYSAPEIELSSLQRIKDFYVRQKPKVMLLGTHKDKLEGSEEQKAKTISSIDEELRKDLDELCHDDRFKRLFLYRHPGKQLIFAVDATGTENEIKYIQNHLYKAVYHFKNMPIPASWFMFAIFLRKMESPVLKLSVCEAIGRELHMEKESVKLALWFLHYWIGIVLHYEDPESGVNDLVICDPHIVFKRVTELITKSFIEDDNIDREAIEEDIAKGIITYEDIEGASKSSDDFNTTQLIDLLSHLNIIAPIKSSIKVPCKRNSIYRKYFMPVILKPADLSRKDICEHGPNDPNPLIIRFKCGIMPIGVFCATIARLKAIGWDFPKKDDSIIHRNVIRFKLEGRATCYVTLMSMPKRFEIHVTDVSNTNKRMLNELCCRVVKEVCGALDCVISEMPYAQICLEANRKPIYELGFVLPCKCSSGGEHEIVNRVVKYTGTVEEMWEKCLPGKGDEQSLLKCLDVDQLEVDSSMLKEKLSSAKFLCWFKFSSDKDLESWNGEQNFTPEDCACVLTKQMNTPDISENPLYMDDYKRTILKKPAPSSDYNLNIQQLKDSVKLILLTCNETEKLAVYEKLKPPSIEGSETFKLEEALYIPQNDIVIGRFAGYVVGVLTTEQGNKLNIPLKKALDMFSNAQAVIAVGVGYGRDRKLINFADVMISDHIENASQVAIIGTGEELKVQQCGARLPIRNELLRYFKNNIESWHLRNEFLVSDQKRISEAKVGTIVSCNTLMRAPLLRDEYMKLMAETIGGEMEGASLLSTIDWMEQDSRQLGVIVIKGVANYGDKKMDKRWQLTASKAAVDFVHYCLEKTAGLGEFVPGMSKTIIVKENPDAFPIKGIKGFENAFIAVAVIIIAIVIYYNYYIKIKNSETID